MEDSLSRSVQENQTLRLIDGRQLGYAVYGTPDGAPVFYFTGGNSSRLEGRWFAEIAERRRVQLIVPDRPGFGLSDFQPARTFLDWPDDVNQLADALGIAQYALFGLSGGGPHVAATVYTEPQRVTRAAIVSGVAPPEMPGRYDGMWFPIRLIFLTARYAPPLNRMALGQMGSFYADPEQMRARMQQALPIPDRELMAARPDIIDTFSAAALEAHRQGIDGDAWEWRLYVRPWGFELGEISVPVSLWYGEVDQNAPPGMGRYLAEQIPNSRLHMVADGGHFSTINNYIDAIFDDLLLQA